MAQEEEQPESETGEADAPPSDSVAPADADADIDDALEAASVDDGPAVELPAAGQLGVQRYILAGFFAAAMLSAYVIGRAVHAIWASFSTKDWFNRAVPALVAVPDDVKSSIALLLGAIVAIVVVVRTYRKPEVRAWTEEVATELAKVKWPTRKEVWNSTVIVIAASTVATVYLALLDRLWAFVTDLVYG